MRHRTILAEDPRAAALRIFGTVILALCLLLGAGTAARAQPACLAHQEMTDLLRVKYAETQIAVGFSESGRLIEVFSTADGATWTLVVTTPKGKSCVLIAGESWDIRHQVAEGPQV